MDVRSIQLALAAAGFAPGPIDGAPGPKTSAAITAFQKTRGLPATGVADPATIAKLFPAQPTAALSHVPPWYAELGRLMGLSETTASGNSTIVGWARQIGGFVARYFTNARTIPWCGLAMAHAIRETLPGEAIPANPLDAGAWTKFGRSLNAPAIGAIMVFARSGGHHVSTYAGETASLYRVRGGNQNNSVNEEWHVKGGLLAIRWPSTYPLPTTGRVMLQPDGKPVGGNEI